MRSVKIYMLCNWNRQKGRACLFFNAEHDLFGPTPATFEVLLPGMNSGKQLKVNPSNKKGVITFVQCC